MTGPEQGEQDADQIGMVGTAGTCEKCGNEPGSPFTFLYGTSETHETSPNTYQTTRSIKGVETVFMGDRCIGRRKARAKVWLGISLAIVLAVVLVGVLGFESGEQTHVFGIPVVVLFLVGPIAALSAIAAGITLASYRDPAEAGLDEAQKVKQQELKKRGFNFTMSPKHWATQKALEPWGGNLPNRNRDLRKVQELSKEYEARIAVLIEQIQRQQADPSALEKLN